MKYRLGSVVIEDIDTYVRVTVRNFGGPESADRVRVTQRECPAALEVAELLAGLRNMRVSELDAALLQACGRAAKDAENNKWLVGPIKE